MAPEQLHSIVQAAIMAAPQPLSLRQLLELFGNDEQVSRQQLHDALLQLQHDCASGGVDLVEVASGWRYQVKPAFHPWVAKLFNERRTRYSRATLETLALIAYRQPITRGEIEQVRGVAVSSQIIQTLEERGWVEVVGHREIAGRPALLGTTKAFLDHFGLSALEQLPALQTLQQSAEALAAADVSPVSPRTTPDQQAPDAAPGTRAAVQDHKHFNAVEMTSVAVDQADSESEGHPIQVGRSPLDE
jgi:segregation and condensation protein B